jgi:hypothetical protein
MNSVGNPNPKLMLLILSALYSGPRYFVKVGEADFVNFLIILLIQAKVNAANNFTPFPQRLPKGSVVKIQEFLHVFKLLSDQQKSIIAYFGDDSDFEGYLRKNFGSDYQKIIDKYEATFKYMLPRLYKLGLKISPNYKGRYACSCAKWVLVKMMFCIILEICPDISKMTKTLSATSENIAFHVSILQDYGTNLFLQLYLQTINEYERNLDPNCFVIAEQEYDKMIVSNYQDYKSWKELHVKYQEKTGRSFHLHPQRWNFYLICWIMNAFENHDSLVTFINEITVD